MVKRAFTVVIASAGVFVLACLCTLIYLSKPNTAIDVYVVFYMTLHSGIFWAAECAAVAYVLRDRSNTKSLPF